MTTLRPAFFFSKSAFNDVCVTLHQLLRNTTNIRYWYNVVFFPFATLSFRINMFNPF
mgnify:CR=1 FL=1